MTFLCDAVTKIKELKIIFLLLRLCTSIAFFFFFLVLCIHSYAYSGIRGATKDCRLTPRHPPLRLKRCNGDSWWLASSHLALHVTSK
ncbi:hypothetical protein P175DRAFT_022956 [Aspergillus ochraceoroseus IBT 24754]|uniref:Uncharacterized protein n=1 Tax=Aspergillus ochraceoroseus IBT 24754 TaxID=1392256 RepID=A0A2T5M6P9_9EURO|nr:uncharacterized protein P175DRAFT_022956 [Aspergillus ochraceoroseus IBT 24754]PTU24199.1 hypothetical protein P175DRAFT_022956 [Aspergillus ochraceoroseus IBT 24754]